MIRSILRQELKVQNFPLYLCISEDSHSAAKFLSSPSLQLNGGKGHKVSPQRPIQSSIYSRNPMPAVPSAAASDHYSVREKGGGGKVEGVPVGWWFSKWILRTPWGPWGRSGGTQQHNTTNLCSVRSWKLLPLNFIFLQHRWLHNKSTTNIFPQRVFSERMLSKRTVFLFGSPPRSSCQ